MTEDTSVTYYLDSDVMEIETAFGEARLEMDVDPEAATEQLTGDRSWEDLDDYGQWGVFVNDIITTIHQAEADLIEVEER